MNKITISNEKGENKIIITNEKGKNKITITNEKGENMIVMINDAGSQLKSPNFCHWCILSESIDYCYISIVSRNMSLVYSIKEY